MAKRLGYLIIAIAVLVSLVLIGVIAAGIFAIGFSILPIGIILAILVILGYVLIKEPDKLEWDFPYIGKVTIGHQNEVIQAQGFDRIVAVADDESTELADALRTIRFEFNEESCDEVAQTLSAGIQARKTTPIEQSIIEMDTLLNSKDFVEESDNLVVG